MPQSVWLHPINTFSLFHFAAGGCTRSLPAACHPLLPNAALGESVLCLQYPGRVEEPELSGCLLVDYLISFCFLFYLPHLGPELRGKVKLDYDGALQTPPKSFFPKNRPPEKRPTWLKLNTHRLEFQISGPMFSCTIFFLPPPRGSSDTNWRVSPEQYTVSRRWQVGWILDCSVAIQMWNKGAGITKDWFMGRVRVNLPPIL